MTTRTPEEMTAYLHELLSGMGRDKDTIDAGLDPQLEEYDPAAGVLAHSFATGPWMRNPIGILHGGITATALDITLGAVCCAFAGHLTPTVSLQSSYLLPGTIGPRLHVRAHITSAGRTLAYVTGSAWQQDEAAPMATATGVYFTGSGTHDAH